MQRLDELELLRIVRSERRPNWGGQSDYTYQRFRADLSVVGDSALDLSDSVISNILNGRPGVDDRKILNLITGASGRAREARATIEASLGLPGLFECQNRSEVVALLAAADGEFGENPKVTVLGEGTLGDLGITQFEAQAVEHLHEALLHDNQPILFWNVAFNSGASTVVHGLWGAFDAPKPYSAMWIIRPSNFAYPYEAELSRLRQYLDERGHGVSTKKAFADAIVAERLLVVLLSAFAMDATVDANGARALLKEFQARQGRWTGAAAILVVGQSEWLGRQKIPNSDSRSGFLKRRLAVRAEAGFVEFQAQWRRFAGLREESPSELAGSRMRRAATYFRVQNTTSIYPISIKVRALFASNVRDASYFDPTQGFRRLAGEVYGQFGDVLAYVDDVSDFIGYVRHIDRTAGGGSRGKRLYFYLLQYVSTSLHWLTEEALDALIDKIEPDRRTPLKLDTEKSRMLAFSPIVTEVRVVNGVAPSSRYFASMGVKAVIQDDWMASEPYLRSLAHYRIAKRLKTHENDKTLLAREFPYEPHWGRSRIFFLSETIRHLVRSSETYSAEASCEEANEYGEFPDPPSSETRGANPAHVINYCYNVLYQDLLNGNANGRASRSLAKRYGAYQLSVEVLELISENFDVGVPHRLLRREQRLEFMRECGFALLDVGELGRSRETFERAMTEAKAAGTEFDVLTIQLDLALIACVSGALVEAASALALARNQMAAIHAAGSNAEARSYLRIRKFFRRLLTREAHFAFLGGDHERALDILDQLENEDRWRDFKDGQVYPRTALVPSFAQSLEAEQVHLKVAALHQKAEAERRPDTPLDMTGLNIAAREMLQAESNGLHHQAMGFRIAVARWHRRANQLDTAEVFLDAVHVDLLRYGCSERTFLSFLNEAGRVLAGRGDAIRAYATYLKPCLGRARARGFRREAQQAATQASMMLSTIAAARDAAFRSGAAEGPTWDEQLDIAAARHKALVAATEHIFSGDILERDPLYAYAIADAEQVIHNLKRPEFIEAERQNILAYLEGDDGAT